MTGPYLLSIALGPVQDFIFQARRSRDLWFGSHLLSELSRATARFLAGEGAELIFPALDKGASELASCDAPTREGDQPPLAIVNKILAKVTSGDPAALAEAARKAVRNEWTTVAERVRRGRIALLKPRTEAVWQEQVEDVLEFYATWVPIGGDYNKARQEAEQALAGRKNVRDFKPWTHDRGGAPKSSLDGGRVSVLPKDRASPEFRRYRIGDGEQLDAIGVIKRTGFKPEQFVPITNIAASAWLRRAERDAESELGQVRRACGDDIPIPRVERRELPVAAPLPFDASVLYPSRWAPLFKELRLNDDPAEWGRLHIRPLLKQMGSEPPAYVACLVADGDHMGKAIGKLDSAEGHRKFSAALGEFPVQARHIVEQKHRGGLVFAGGDDVLAFLPVATACACAEELAQAFRGIMAKAAPADAVPTLSVGIAVGHMLESMSVLLALGRDAERAAKDNGRNSLAVIVDKRSGGQRRFALSWSDEPLRRLQADAKLLDDALSTGKVHELEALLRRFPDPRREKTMPAGIGTALGAYAAEVLRHTGDDSSKAATLHDLGVPPPGADCIDIYVALRQAIDRVLIVRTMREAGFA